MKSLVKKLSIVMVATAAMLSVSQAFAKETLDAQQIGRLINYGELVVMQMSGVSDPGTDGCSRFDFVGFDSSTGAGRQFLAMALTAIASEAEVKIRLSGCIDWAGNTIPKVFFIES